MGHNPALLGMSGMMVVESAGLSEPWFEQLKKEGDAFLIGAGKISVGMNPQHLAQSLAHIAMQYISWLIMRKM